MAYEFTISKPPKHAESMLVDHVKKAVIVICIDSFSQKQIAHLKTHTNYTIKTQSAHIRTRAIPHLTGENIQTQSHIQLSKNT